jgi:hypothetical protein
VEFDETGEGTPIIDVLLDFEVLFEGEDRVWTVLRNRSQNKRKGEPEPNHKSRPVLTSDENNYSFSGELSIQPKIPKHIDDGDYYPIVITEKNICAVWNCVFYTEWRGIPNIRRFCKKTSSRESAGFSFPIYHIYISALCRCSILDVRRWEEFPPRSLHLFHIWSCSLFFQIFQLRYRADTGIVLAARTTGIACMCRSSCGMAECNAHGFWISIKRTQSVSCSSST